MKENQAFELMVDAANVGTWDWNVQTGATIFNERWAEMLGYTLAELEPVSIQTWVNLAHPDDLQQSNRLLDEHFGGQTEDYRCESRMRHKDGHWVWVMDRGKVFSRDSAGKPLRMLGAHTDISELKAAQANLHALNRSLEERAEADNAASDVRFAAVFDASPVSIAITRASDSRLVNVNQAWLNVTGYTREQAIGHTAAELGLWVVPNDRDRIIGMLKEKGKAAGVEVTLRSQSGEGRSYLMSAEFSELAGESCIISTAVDITGLKQVEAALRDSHEIAEAIINAANESIFLMEINGTVIAANDTFAARVKTSVPDLLGTNVLERIPPDKAAVRREHVATVARERKPAVFEDENDGVWVESRIYPVTDSDGHVRRVAVYGRDITERRAADERLRQIQRRLIHSEKMEALGLLAGGIAHDFNNILTGIIGYASMSQKHAEYNPILAQHLEKVLTASERAKHLTQQILAFSRQSVQEKVIIDIQSNVKEVLDLLKASVPSSVRIETSLQPDKKFVLADPTKIHEVVLNLVTNAVHAMNQKGTLTVRLSAGSFDQLEHLSTGDVGPGEYSVIEISDTGCGMDGEVLSKAFQPFFTTKGVGEGTGMGLSVVLGVVQSHGGNINVSSVVGIGTTFKVYLPVATASAPPPRIEEAKAELVGTERVLFVDDEQMLRDLAEKGLSQWGYRVTCMSNGRDALRFMESHGSEIDILVTDQTMPLLTGIELAQEALKLREGLPIILCTGFSNAVYPGRTREIGVLQLISKPYTVREICKSIRAIMDKRKKAV